MREKNLMKILVLMFLFLSVVMLSSEPIDWDGYTSIYVVKDIYEDGDYLWIGTFGGLVKLNKETGERVVYTTANSGLTSNFITGIAKDNAGNLWIGTDHYYGDYLISPDYFGGLHLWDTEDNWVVYQSNNSPLPSNSVCDVETDSIGNVWVATYYGGLARLSPDGEWTIFNLDNTEMNSMNVTSILITENDEIWLTLDEYQISGTTDFTGGGVASYIDGVWTDYFDIIPKRYDTVRFWDSDISADGTIWFAGGYDSYYSYDGNEFICYDFPFEEELQSLSSGKEFVTSSHRFPNHNRSRELPELKTTMKDGNLFSTGRNNPEEMLEGSVNTITLDNCGNLWLGTSHGIAMFNGDDWIFYDNYNSPIAEYNISGIYPISDDRILIASSFYGLYVYNNGIIELMDISDPESGLTCMNIWSVNAEHSTHAWIGSGYNILNNGTGGLTGYDGEEWVNYSYDSIANYLVNDIKIKDDVIYLATGNDHHHGGVVYNDGTGWTAINYTNSNLEQLYAASIAVDSQNNIWIGRPDVAYGGVACYNGSSWTHYNSMNSGLLTNEVYTVEVDPLTDDLWVGTKTGLYRFDGTNWSIFHPGNTPALQTGEIWNLYFDDNNILWVGTLIGLTSYDGTSWRNYNSVLPVLGDGSVTPVNSTTMDEYGRIWHGTLGGIVLFDGEDVEIYDGSNSPLPSNWTLHISSDRDGRMWVGTAVTGLYTFTYTGDVSFVDDIINEEQGFILTQNYPNPFNPETTISFSIEDRDAVSVEIFNLKGQKVKTLVNDQVLDPGTHNIIWNGRDNQRRPVSSGVYFYRVSYQGQSQTRRMMMIK